jgi:hypothetical protein
MVLMHIHDDIINATGGIDQEKIDLVARMGSDWYCRTSQGMFEVAKPNKNLGMGVDQLSADIRLSTVLTGNDLGMLGNEQTLPDRDSIEVYKRMNKDLAKLHIQYAEDEKALKLALHQLAHEYLLNGKTADAWKVLLS